MPTAAATWRAVRALSPVRRIGVSPSETSSADEDRVAFDRAGDSEAGGGPEPGHGGQRRGRSAGPRIRGGDDRETAIAELLKVFDINNNRG